MSVMTLEINLNPITDVLIKYFFQFSLWIPFSHISSRAVKH